MVPCAYPGDVEAQRQQVHDRDYLAVRVGQAVLVLEAHLMVELPDLAFHDPLGEGLHLHVQGRVHLQPVPVQVMGTEE